MNRVGILGGTFDPVHMGHLIIAENAYEQYGLDEVWLMPSGMPPHKSGRNVTASDDRMNMVSIAIAENPHFKLSDFELKRTGYIYTADTLRLLSNEYKDTKFFFIIGEDSLDNFDTWKTPEEIVKFCTILVASRSESHELKGKVSDFQKKYKCEAGILVTPFLDISSSDIRDRVSTDKTIRYMVIPEVEKYIYDNHLYKSNGM